MFKAERVNRATMISSRKDVIDFYVKAVENIFNLQVKSQLLETKDNSSVTTFVDISPYQDRIQFVIDNRIIFKDSIFIISNDVPEYIKVLIGNYFERIIMYPCEVGIANFFIHKYLFSNNSSKNKKNFFYEEMEKNNNETVKFFNDFIGCSTGIKKTKADLLKFANSDEPVLIMGESGTGKTVLAKKIHEISKRSNRAFRSMNVAEIGENLASSTFFGTEQGAYTDAKKHNGIFKQANGGTLFLDEIGLASVNVQSKLLTVLDSGQIYSVGSNKQEKVDVRMIFATNANLRTKMTKGEFRKDLYFRIANSVVYIPPLRERKSDIKEIAAYYADKKSKSLTKKAFEKLEDYDWPGNVRQLKSCIMNAVLYSESSVIKDDYINFNL